MSSQSPTNLRVLVVEDSEHDWHFMQRAIERSPYKGKVQRVEDGGDALIYLMATPTPPDVMLIDLGLPKVSGFDLLEWVRDNPERRPRATLVLSSSVNPTDVSRAYELGTDAYFVKPLQPEAFDELIRAILTYWTFGADALRMNAMARKE